jgi:hypothetical protein
MLVEKWMVKVILQTSHAEVRNMLLKIGGKAIFVIK